MPFLSGSKEKLAALVPRYIAEVTRYDASLEDIPTDRFGSGLERARQTLRATTQKGTRSALLPISRRYRADR